MRPVGPFLLAGILLAASAWFWAPPVWRRLRRSRVRRRPFPAPWRDILRRRMPAFARLPADLQLQLKKHVQVLLAEKPFIGCAGLEVDDEMRVLIAAQASLLQLNRRAGGFPNLRQVLVYPGAFVVAREVPDAAGLVRDERRVLAATSSSTNSRTSSTARPGRRTVRRCSAAANATRAGRRCCRPRSTTCRRGCCALSPA
jgi:MtfA peptidase